MSDAGTGKENDLIRCDACPVYTEFERAGQARVTDTVTLTEN